MASTSPPATDGVDAPKPPAHYAERADAGDATWLEDAVEDYLGIRVGEAQRRICRAVATNKQLLVVSANSLGKSYILAAITIVWLSCRYPAAAFATSGTERKMKRTYCKPVESLHGDARIPLPGEYKSRPERIEIDGEPEHFFEASSPRDAGELEGVHGAYTLALIEEADKPAVDEDVIEAMRSLATDDRDRLVLIANPPEDETNSIYPLMDDHPNWEVLRFSTFDAHNVQVELGNVDAPKIDGIAGISKLKDDWVEYNSSEWPGIDTALRVSAPKLDADDNLVFRNDDDLEDNPAFRTDLSKRWHRRRAGIMPPLGAAAHRPFSVEDVENAWRRDHPILADTPAGSGIDVARARDRTVHITAGNRTNGQPGPLDVQYDEQGANHVAQEADLRDNLAEYADHPTPVDAVGEGSGLADSLQESFPEIIRFRSGATPNAEAEYKDCWTEGLAALGEWLREGGSITSRELREELLAAARTVTFDERYLASRESDGAEVLEATSKDAVKEHLGRSPDYLDAALMAVWAADDNVGTTKTVRRRPGGSPSTGSV